MSNYLIYPFKVMRITQTYLGRTSHYPHTQGTPRDYPIDEGCSDTGRDWMYCPMGKWRITRIYGVGSKGVNTLWLESCYPLLFADGTLDYATMLATHPNDDDLRKLSVGQVFHSGDKICREGTDGASGNHIHLSVGKGKMKGNGWTQNSKGKYVLTTTGVTLKPEQAFYIDQKFTKIVNSAGLKFKELPKYTTDEYRVIDKVHVRAEPKASAIKLKYDEFTKNAQEQIKKLNGKKANYFVNGMEFTVSKVTSDGKYHFGLCPSGWVALEHCKKI